ELPLVRAIRGEEVDEAEVIVRNEKKPQSVVLSINARPLRGEQGSLRGGVIVFRDVTARKRSEEELRQSRERFELAVAGSPDGLWDWDLRANTVWYWERFRSMLGYDEDESPTQPGEWEKRLHPDDHDRAMATLRAHVKGSTAHYILEHRLRHKDGSYRWILG